MSQVPEIWENNSKNSSLLINSSQANSHCPFLSSAILTTHCTLSQDKKPILQGFCCWPGVKVAATLSAVSLQERCLCVWKKTSALHGSFSGVSPVDLVLSGAEYLICGGNKGSLRSQKTSCLCELGKPMETCAWCKIHSSQRETFHLLQRVLAQTPCVMLRHTLCLVKAPRCP